jgi:hypothetical protein
MDVQGYFWMDWHSLFVCEKSWLWHHCTFLLLPGPDSWHYQTSRFWTTYITVFHTPLHSTVSWHSLHCPGMAHSFNMSCWSYLGSSPTCCAATTAGFSERKDSWSSDRRHCLIPIQIRWLGANENWTDKRWASGICISLFTHPTLKPTTKVVGITYEQWLSY